MGQIKKKENARPRTRFATIVFYGFVNGPAVLLLLLLLLLLWLFLFLSLAILFFSARFRFSTPSISSRKRTANK